MERPDSSFECQKSSLEIHYTAGLCGLNLVFKCCDAPPHWGHKFFFGMDVESLFGIDPLAGGIIFDLRRDIIQAFSFQVGEKIADIAEV